MMKIQEICISSLLLAPVSSHALDIYLQAGLHFGGDELGTVTFTSGETESLKAGELFSLSAGVGFDVTENLESRFLAGLKFDMIDAENGTVDFTRYPLEALLMYKASEEILIGGGLSYHLNPSVSGEGFAAGADIDFDNALGFVLEFDYQLPTDVYFGVKLTSIDYEVAGISVNGSSIGAIVGIRF